MQIAQDLESTEALTAFPNPSGGEFEASFYVAQGQRATLSLNDMLGRELWQKTVIGEGIQREKITLSEAAAGTYLLVLRREGAGPRTIGPERAVESKRVLIVR